MKPRTIAQHPEPEPGHMPAPPSYEIITNGEATWCRLSASHSAHVAASDPATLDLIAERATQAAAALRAAQAPPVPADPTLFEVTP